MVPELTEVIFADGSEPLWVDGCITPVILRFTFDPEDEMWRGASNNIELIGAAAQGVFQRPMWSSTIKYGPAVIDAFYTGEEDHNAKLEPGTRIPGCKIRLHSWQDESLTQDYTFDPSPVVPDWIKPPINISRCLRDVIYTIEEAEEESNLGIANAVKIENDGYDNYIVMTFAGENHTTLGYEAGTYNIRLGSYWQSSMKLNQYHEMVPEGYVYRISDNGLWERATHTNTVAYADFEITLRDIIGISPINDADVDVPITLRWEFAYHDEVGYYNVYFSNSSIDEMIGTTSNLSYPITQLLQMSDGYQWYIQAFSPDGKHHQSSDFNTFATVDPIPHLISPIDDQVVDGKKEIKLEWEFELRPGFDRYEWDDIDVYLAQESDELLTAIGLVSEGELQEEELIDGFFTEVGIVCGHADEPQELILDSDTLDAGKRYFWIIKATRGCGVVE